MTSRTQAQTDLCLACAGCLPPVRNNPDKRGSTFTTSCCGRPICAACLAANARLARYNPCLACLGGARALTISSRAGDNASADAHSRDHADVNVDGALRERDCFVIEDEPDDGDEGGDNEEEEKEPGKADESA